MLPSEDDSKQFLDAIARAINALVYGETFMHRVLWAELTLQLLRDLPRSLFEKYFIDGILKLTSDSVSNVRISVANLLSSWSPTHPSPFDVDSTYENCPWKWLLEKDEIKDCIVRLSKDDNDVFVAMSKVKQLFPDIEFVSYSCRGLKRAPGGVVPVSLNNNQDTKNLTEKKNDLKQNGDDENSRGVSPASSLSSKDDMNDEEFMALSLNDVDLSTTAENSFIEYEKDLVEILDEKEVENARLLDRISPTDQLIEKITIPDVDERISPTDEIIEENIIPNVSERSSANNELIVENILPDVTELTKNITVDDTIGDNIVLVDDS
jgi:hypothetical protein